MSWKEKISNSIANTKKNINLFSNDNTAYKSSKITPSVNQAVSEGDVGIRKALNSYGIDNGKIGYREDNGNGIVTVGGKDFLTANAVKDGVSYAPLGAIQNAFNAMQRENGDPIVKVGDYVTSKGLGANLGYNAQNQTVSIGGNEFKPSYIENGISYAPQSAVDKAINDYKNNTGILNYAELIKKNNEEYGAYTKKLIDALTERERFTYNPESDPAYLAYKAMYEREGKRAAEEAVAAYAGLNGGLGTSAAVTAAAQAQNAWLDKLNDRVPELYDSAYRRYINDRSFDIDALSQIENLKQNALNNEMSANKELYDAVAGENERNRQRYIDELNRKWTEEDRDYTKRANELSLAEGNLNLDNAQKQSILNNATVRGYFTEDEANALGVDVNTNPLAAASRLELYTYGKQKGIDADYDVDTYGRKLELEAQYAPIASSGGSRSGGGRSGSSASSGYPKATLDGVKSVVNNINASYKSDLDNKYLIQSDNNGNYYFNPTLNLSDDKKRDYGRKIANYLVNMGGDQTDVAAFLLDALGIDNNTFVTEYQKVNEPTAYNNALKKDLYAKTDFRGGISRGY